MELTRPHLLPAGGWILVGVPHTVAQARELDEELERRSISPDRVVLLEGPDDDELIERVVGGRRQSLATGLVYHLEYDPPPEPEQGRDPGPFVQREDDTEEALRRQLESWHQEADDIKEHYEEQGVFAVVDASRTVDGITDDIIEALGHPRTR